MNTPHCTLHLLLPLLGALYTLSMRSQLRAPSENPFTRNQMYSRGSSDLRGGLVTDYGHWKRKFSSWVDYTDVEICRQCFKFIGLSRSRLRQAYYGRITRHTRRDRLQVRRIVAASRTTTCLFVNLNIPSPVFRASPTPQRDSTSNCDDAVVNVSNALGIGIRASPHLPASWKSYFLSSIPFTYLQQMQKYMKLYTSDFARIVYHNDSKSFTERFFAVYAYCMLTKFTRWSGLFSLSIQAIDSEIHHTVNNTLRTTILLNTTSGAHYWLIITIHLTHHDTSTIRTSVITQALPCVANYSISRTKTIIDSEHAFSFAVL